ncbi:uncharacterized protein LOC125064186 isoform X2 [Vanessa atalanta]|uniref:uncharacterized protein LOC125064186 isoform X2 n=1 Tax=Vanessa atalanta TaxID=42275 RepID=UPI001FCCC481|nr:uncharacterized protein LOC125064186 isoform X2 [Vanessa atalanta]
MSIGRVCRRRWNCVWKRTAERWTNWSKPPHKFRKFRSINLKKISKWDDAVQTTIFVYNETGASVRSASSDKSYLRHANVGPSMFRFHAQPLKLIGNSPNQSKATSYKSLRGYCNSFDTKANECSFPYGIPGDEIKDRIKNVESKNLSAIIEPSSVKSVDYEPKDAYTQMLITCNNAETNIKLTSDIVKDFLKVEACDEFVCSTVDEGVQTLISSKSQRSIKTMTSTKNLQGFVHKEIQASPVPSFRKVSTVFVDQEPLQDGKSSVVTDTSVPYRRLNNNLLTAKGTILTCTGTKITSVSSVHIQTASFISRSPKITMSAAVSTHLNTENRDCSTAPSLLFSNLEDVSMGTDYSGINRSEKSTSYAQFTDYINAGISTSNLVQQISFNDGPHYTQDSFGAEVCPECSSICINTDIETKQMSIETGSSLEFKNGRSKIDGCSQYSARSSNRSNQLSNSSGHSAHIGQSRLLSVRNLGESLYVPPQQTVCSSLDKKVKITQQRSVLASQTTSIDASSIQQPSNDIQASPDTGNIADYSKPSCNDPMSTIESNSNRITPSAEPNAVTSNLNAAKWIKGYVNDSKKDIQSVINLSESTVTESLERASYAISNCDDKKSLDEMKNLSNIVINQKRAINCVSAKPLEVVSTISVTEIRPTKENTQSNEKPLASNKPSDSRKFVVDQIISGQVFPSDVTESVQVRPEVQDAATGSISIKICHSNFAGSSHILPKLLSYCDGNINTDNEGTRREETYICWMKLCHMSMHQPSMEQRFQDFSFGGERTFSQLRNIYGSKMPSATW